MNESQTPGASPDPFADEPELLRAIEEAPIRQVEPIPGPLLALLERERAEALKKRKEARSFRSVIALASLGLAAAIAVSFVFLRPPVSDAPPMAKVTITSPGDSTADTRPVFAWTSKDRPDQRYDVWVLPEEGDVLTVPALFEAEDVVSPVTFDQLTTVAATGKALAHGEKYRVLVCLADAGRLAGTPVPFSVREP